MRYSRRRFLQHSMAVGLGLPLFVHAKAFGANSEIRMAVIGCGCRGSVHINEFGKQDGVRLAAVCDPDRRRAASSATAIEKLYGYRPDEVVDVRRLFDRKDLDAVSIATMQYWHALPMIWACETGRDVYVEKPLAHYVWEGRQMVNAAKKYNRIVQVGLQNRSHRGYVEMGQWLRAGNLGKIQYATCFANKPRKSIGKRTEPLPIPETLDYELWCGPAKKEPIYRNQIQYDCSFTWNMGDGEACNQGVHEIDVARWLLGYSELPRRVLGIGGRFVFNDAGDVPNTQILCYDYPQAPIIYEFHNLPKSKEYMTPEKWSTLPNFKGAGVGVCVQCEGGYTLGGSAFDNNGKHVKAFGAGENHFVNFIAAVRSGKKEDLNAPIEEGHLSTAICHMGNISYRVGQTASVEQQRNRIGDFPCFREMHDRYVSYLEGIEVDPNTSMLGEWLEIDQANECIKDNDVANGIVKGSYRDPFTIPTITLDAAAAKIVPGAAAIAGTALGKVRIAKIDDQQAFRQVAALVENDNPGLHFRSVAIDGDTTLRSEFGGMRVFWIYRGKGEVFLPKGYRTQEGDGEPLSDEYVPEPLSPEFAETLRVLNANIESFGPETAVAIRAVLKRWKNGAFTGNYAGDLWTLEHAPKPWAKDPAVQAAVESLFHTYRDVGFSVKKTDSFEPVTVGDQIIVCGDEAVRVRGNFLCLAVENEKRSARHESAVRRIRYLMDTAGGCNPDFDPFRRLPLTWYPNYPGESGDGLNWINSHIVNIPEESSPTHFHPARAIGGTLPQREMYLVLDPAAYQLNTWGRKASLVLYPNLHDLCRFEQHDLEPGTFVYIPPGTGHRGLNAFVNVLTIPGFRPHNEYYIDQDVFAATEGKAPYNKNLLNAKNYSNIDDLL